MDRPRICVIYFSHDNQAIDCLPFTLNENRDLRQHELPPLWRPSQHIVCSWARQPVCCRDERWIAFGPFDTVEHAKTAVDTVARVFGSEAITGYRIETEHCASYLHHLEMRIWGDG